MRLILRICKAIATTGPIDGLLIVNLITPKNIILIVQLQSKPTQNIKLLPDCYRKVLK